MSTAGQAALADVFLYDTTLRDGAQMRGISFSVGDKLRITGILDAFGVHYIEGGWPGSNPKDCEYFEKVKALALKNSRVVAFGSTRRKQIAAQDDANLQALLAAETPAVAVFGKAWLLHVNEVLRVSAQENLAMVAESVHLLKSHGREVIYDAEHFFDGFRSNAAYALETLRAAVAAGADWLVLCDTNGGTLPAELKSVCAMVLEHLTQRTPVGVKRPQLGIHAHNDAELAVANSLAAVEGGVGMVQGTINGFGERCGNANLVSIAPALELKMGKRCLPPGSLARVSSVAHAVSEIANWSLNPQAAYVGLNAFTHKAGVHASAVEKVSASYEHITPEQVGNKRTVVMSELAGRGNVRNLAQRLGVEAGQDEQLFLNRVKELEARGFTFEDAEESLELMLLRRAPEYRAPFELVDVMVVSSTRPDEESEAQAIVRLKVNGERLHTAAEGRGPVEAVDQAMRKALIPYFPALSAVRLCDYKVRIIDPDKAASATTRVNIEASCGERHWNTVGCSPNVIDASFRALSESFEYFLLTIAAADVRASAANV